jgi:predicted transcriptional regulator
MLRESELRVLQALDTEQSVSEIADRFDRSTSYMSETVSNLEDKQLVLTRRGREKTVAPVDHGPVEILHRLKHTHPHIDFPDLISGKALSVLYCFDGEYTVAELAEKTEDYRNTVNRVVTRLRDRGVLHKDGSKYGLNPEFELLHEFAQEYVHHRHHVTASRMVSSFTILWESLTEFLLQASETVSDDWFLETGPTRFQDFGIPLVTTSQQYHLYSDDRSELTASELVCHTLVISDETRYQTYCLLIIEKEAIPQEDLISTAEKYDVGKTVKSLYTYLETRGTKRDTKALPKWGEFESVANEYGVVV